MKNFFNLDSPFMVFLSNLTDVVIVNVLCILCCLPIITIGPAITATHYVTLKMVREDSGYVVRNFFKSFKENFKQSTAVWLMFLLISVICFLDQRILQTTGMDEKGIFRMAIGAIYLFICFTVMYAFPLLSYFENTFRQTIKNAMLMSILHIFKTILMAVIYVIPFFLLTLHTTMIPVFLIIGIAGPAYINSFLWKGIFKKYEPVKETEEIRPDLEFEIPEE